MRQGVRTVAPAGGPEATYTLRSGESFRLDAANFSTLYALDGFVLVPSVLAQTQAGATIGEATGPLLNVGGHPTFGGFAYTGPAVMADSDSLSPPSGYLGYLVHDFGAAHVAGPLNVTWPQPTGQPASIAGAWLRSPGAVTVSAPVGGDVAVLSNSVTFTLTAAVPAGDYLMLAVALQGRQPFFITHDSPDITVTDSVGGNALKFGGLNDPGFAPAALYTTQRAVVEAFFPFYKINNALAIGDTVTVTLNSSDILWMGVAAHDVAGLNATNPLGPNPGGFPVEFGNFLALNPNVLASPSVIGGSAADVFTGAVLLAGVYAIEPGGTLDVRMARGGVEITPPTAVGEPANTLYTQASLPKTLRLIEGDTITVQGRNSDGTVRVGDVIGDVTLWGLDDA